MENTNLSLESSAQHQVTAFTRVQVPVLDITAEEYPDTEIEDYLFDLYYRKVYDKPLNEDVVMR